MAVVKNLLVRAGADFSAITQQAKKASAGMKSMSTSVSASAAKIKSALGAIGIGLSVAALVSAAKDAAAAYDAQAEAEVKLAQVMRNTMSATNGEIQSILDLTSAQQQLGIVGDEVQLAGAQELATYLSLTDSLKTLIPVMNDMAVQQYGYNVTAEQTTTIATMLGKVMSGQVSGLSRYGYYFDEAQEKVLKYGTEAERAAMLAEVVGQSVGGMNAALAATPTGRMKQLSNTLGDIKEQFGQAVRTIGTVFLPLLNTVAKVLSAVASLANRVAQAIANVFGGKAAGKDWQFIPQGSAAAVSDTASAVSDLTDEEKKSAKAAKKNAQELQQASFDTLNILKDNRQTDTDEDENVPSMGDMGGSMIQEVGNFSEEAEGSLSGIEKFLQRLKTAWEEFKEGIDLGPMTEAWDRLKEAVGRLAAAVGELFAPIWENVLMPFGQWTINEAIPTIINGIADAIGWLSQKISDFAALLSGDISFKEWLDTLTPAETIIGAVVTAIVTVTTAISTFKTVTGTVRGVITGVQTAFTLLTSPVGLVIIAIAAAIAIGVLLYKNWDTIKEKAAELKDKVVTKFNDIKDGIAEKVQTAKENVIGKATELRDGFLQKVNDLKDRAIEKFNTLRDKIKGVVDKVKEFFNIKLEFPKPKLPHLSITYTPATSAVAKFFGIDSIPHINVSWYAKGGIVDGATLIGAGEAGKEAIVPLERHTEWISRVADQLRAEAFPFAGEMPDVIQGEGESIVRAVMMAADQIIGEMRNGRSRSDGTDLDTIAREITRVQRRQARMAGI